jgi:hypothetical protein
MLALKGPDHNRSQNPQQRRLRTAASRNYQALGRGEAKWIPISVLRRWTTAPAHDARLSSLCAAGASRRSQAGREGQCETCGSLC